MLTAPRSGTYYYGACVDAVSGESGTTNNCSRGVEVEVSGGGGGGGGDSYCRDGQRIDNGTECDIHSTDTVVEIDSSGRFCTRNVPGIGAGCATDRVGGQWLIDARGGIRIYITRTTSAYWTMDDVEPEPAD